MSFPLQVLKMWPIFLIWCFHFDFDMSKQSVSNWAPSFPCLTSMGCWCSWSSCSSSLHSILDPSTPRGGRWKNNCFLNRKSIYKLCGFAGATLVETREYVVFSYHHCHTSSSTKSSPRGGKSLQLLLRNVETIRHSYSTNFFPSNFTKWSTKILRQFFFNQPASIQYPTNSSYNFFPIIFIHRVFSRRQNKKKTPKRHIPGRCVVPGWWSRRRYIRCLKRGEFCAEAIQLGKEDGKNI